MSEEKKDWNGFVRTEQFRGHTPQVRVYYHKSGFELYSSEKRDPTMDLINALEKHDSELKSFNYVLAVAWGDINKKERIIEFFGYREITEWPGNPEVSSLIIKNNILVPQREITCGDTLILLGEEEKYRRTTRSLDEYFTYPPHLIPGLFWGGKYPEHLTYRMPLKK